jgi:nucleoside-diphosphate-sugar epimerase
MQVVVTGAGSELGQQLLRALVAGASLRRFDGTLAPLRRVLGVDRAQPSALFVDERVEYVRGDFEQPRFLARMMGAATDSVFHLAALGAGQGTGADADGLDLALARSVDATRCLIDACQFQPTPPRLVFAGLLGLRSAPGDVPRTIEGVCVDVCETLLVEAARRGIIDLCSVRLPAPGQVEASLADTARAAAALLEAHELRDRSPAQRIVEMDGGGILRATSGD